jgi:hypothetical protein
MRMDCTKAAHIRHVIPVSDGIAQRFDREGRLLVVPSVAWH